MFDTVHRSAMGSWCYYLIDVRYCPPSATGSWCYYLFMFCSILSPQCYGELVLLPVCSILSTAVLRGVGVTTCSVFCSILSPAVLWGVGVTTCLMFDTVHRSAMGSWCYYLFCSILSNRSAMGSWCYYLFCSILSTAVLRGGVTTCSPAVLWGVGVTTCLMFDTVPRSAMGSWCYYLFVTTSARYCPPQCYGELVLLPV